jgi:hypothetical protein
MLSVARMRSRRRRDPLHPDARHRNNASKHGAFDVSGPTAPQCLQTRGQRFESSQPSRSARRPDLRDEPPEVRETRSNTHSLVVDACTAIEAFDRESELTARHAVDEHAEQAAMRHRQAVLLAPE